MPIRHFVVEFIISDSGQVEQVVVNESNEYGGTYTQTKNAYLSHFFQNLPLIKPFVEYYGSQMDIRIDYYFAAGYTSFDSSAVDIAENGSITRMTQHNLQYYVLESSKLGWINCDYFWGNQEEKADFVVKVDPDAQPNVKLLFPAQNSIMNVSEWEDDKMIFSNIPLNQPVKIIALKFDGTKPLMAIANTKTGKDVFDKLDYKEFTLEELKKQLSK